MSIILFDLEQTLINSWWNPDSLNDNIEKIKNWLELHGQWDAKFGILSWALHDRKDIFAFNERLKEPLEGALDIHFQGDFIFSMESICHIILDLRGKYISKDDMFELFGKEECLLNMMRFGHFGDNDVYLIDDNVTHELKFSAPNSGSVTFLNIYEM